MKLPKYKRSMLMRICLGLMFAFGFTFSFSTAMAFPPMPAELQMVEPDPSLPKELKEFWGKWEWKDSRSNVFIIIEKIDDKNATLWLGQEIKSIKGWEKQEADVAKEFGKYIVWYRGKQGSYKFSLKGETLIWSIPPSRSFILKRVP